MKTYQVRVRLKPSLLDAQGQVIKNALNDLGFAAVENVRVGKLIELTLNSEDSLASVDEMCRKLLANPVIEDYEIIG